MKSSPGFDVQPFRSPIHDPRLQSSRTLTPSLYVPLPHVFLPVATTVLVSAAVTIAPRSPPAPLALSAFPLVYRRSTEETFHSLPESKIHQSSGSRERWWGMAERVSFLIYRKRKARNWGQTWERHSM